jgi:DNA-binding NarL/FixJ family response regulator
MSNHLSMSHQQAIIGLIERGWSQHRVARELDVDRKTVRRHVRLSQAACKRRLKSETGSRM